MAWQGNGQIQRRSFPGRWKGKGVPGDSWGGVGLKQSPGPDEWVGRGRLPGESSDIVWRGEGTLSGSSASTSASWAGAGMVAAFGLSTSLIARLDERLEDIDPENYMWGIDLKYEMLSEAQREVANMLDNAYLSNLQRMSPTLNVSGGSVALSQVSSEILGGSKGIAGVRVTPAGRSPVWADPITKASLKVYQEPGGFRRASDKRAKYYVWADKIHVLIDSYSLIPGYGTVRYATADVLYVAVPPDIKSSIPPVLDKNLHGALLDWAAFKIFKMDEDARADSHKQDAIGQITVLNERVST